MTAFHGGLCFLVFTVILVFLFLTIPLAVNYKYSPPYCFIEEFYVPALDLSQLHIPSNNSNSNNNNDGVVNPCLFFDLAFGGKEDGHAINYGDINYFTFSYGGKAVANYVVPSFKQDQEKTEYRRDVVESGGVPWENAVEAVLNGSTVVFRVDFAARPKRLKDFGVYSKRQHVRIGADVEVDGSGMKVKKKHILLNSAASQLGGAGAFVLFSFYLFCLFFLLCVTTYIS